MNAAGWEGKVGGAHRRARGGCTRCRKAAGGFSGKGFIRGSSACPSRATTNRRSAGVSITRAVKSSGDR
jgi:hypothetical protein